MGKQISIDVRFGENISPKTILMAFIENDWSYIYEGQVEYVPSYDVERFDWQSVPAEEFKFDSFLASHNQFDKIALVIVTENKYGGTLLVYPDWTSLSISINRKYIGKNKNLVDFTWYLKRIDFIFDIVKASDINCSIVY